MRSVAIAALLVALVGGACGSGTAPTPTFGLAIRNAGDRAVRLNVVVVTGQRPPSSLLIPAGSGLLQVPDAPMTVVDGKPVDVVVEIYTDTCSPVRDVPIGKGRTLLVIGQAFSVTTTVEADADAAGAVAPATASTC
jgi:hypothetical protein